MLKEVQLVHAVPILVKLSGRIWLIRKSTVWHDTDSVEALSGIVVENGEGDVSGSDVSAVSIPAVGKDRIPTAPAVEGILDAEATVKVVDFHCASIGARREDADLCWGGVGLFSMGGATMDWDLVWLGAWGWTTRVGIWTGCRWYLPELRRNQRAFNVLARNLEIQIVERFVVALVVCLTENIWDWSVDDELANFVAL
jgi:hypothetical protein